MSNRLELFRNELKDHNLDAMLITTPINRFYLSGFDGTAGVLLIGFEQAFLVTDFRYIDQASAQAKAFTVHRWQNDLYKSLAPLIDIAGWEKIGFEAKNVVVSSYEELKKSLPCELVALDSAVEKLRLKKTVAEIDKMQQGARVLDQGFEFICNIIKPGMREKDLALELEIYLLRQGATEMAFRFIVASGERGAMPHGTASDRVMEKGDLVTIDYGAVFDGYSTDMTRTVALGWADEKQKEIYDLVLRGQEQARQAVKPGMQASELDAVARNSFDQAGYADYFGHGLGHGIGLETHEEPVLNSRSRTILEEGMVITVEPGIYINGWGGIRIEDMVQVTGSGGKSLTTSPRELIVV